jgi:transcription initiation factor TFIIIB Brf1 subunit/transcription initiation factor TFIIB
MLIALCPICHSKKIHPLKKDTDIDQVYGCGECGCAIKENLLIIIDDFFDTSEDEDDFDY